MGLPVEINPLFVSSTGGYTVGRSLRFRSSASAYLNRTPASASNRTTWTWSGWVKRGLLTTTSKGLFSAVSGLETLDIVFEGNTGATADTLRFVYYTGSALNGNLVSTPVYRDPSAWYHIVAVWNTTDATSSNRMRLYVNGVEVTAFGTASYPTQNTSALVNNTVSHTIGRYSSTTNYFDGYLAEVNFIDGQALTPTSFGAYDTNGVWQPAKYTGTYGTNGFYLPFSNTSSTTTLVADASGNGNNWTPNNISLTAGTTYDSMIDSPTVSATASNYAVWNPLTKNGVQNGVYTTATISNGNLLATGGAINTLWSAASSIVLPTTGKWYFEVTMSATGFGNGAAGLFSLSNSSANCYARLGAGAILNGSTSYAYTGYNTGSPNRIGIAYDADNNKYWQTDINGTWLNSKTPGVDTTGLVSGLTAAGDYVVGWWYNSGGESNLTASVNFGQQPFSYTQPTGFNALNTYNLPAATIKNGAQYMAATTYTGNGSTLAVLNSANTAIGTTFQPDFVWIKSRSNIYNNILQDSVRGAGKNLQSNTTNAETGNSGDLLTSFNSNGFTVNNTYLGGTDPSTDGSGATYVGWQWKAGGTGVSNTSGTITSTVSANTTAGFSVVTWTGTFAAATVGHGLGVAPSMIIVKTRTQAAVDWAVYHTSIGATNGLYLNATNAQFATSTWWNNTSPTSSVFSVAGAAQTNGNAQNMVAYCFAAVRGYSAFGSYTNNGSADGAFVYTGFRPRYVLLKRTDSTGDWIIFDTSRDTYNVVSNELYTDSSAAEVTGTGRIDILSNGFKIRITTSEPGYTNGSTMIYAAFAENPFNSSRAR